MYISYRSWMNKMIYEQNYCRYHIEKCVRALKCPHNHPREDIWRADHDAATNKIKKNVTFGLYEYFFILFIFSRITISLNTMKIKSWVPQAMNNPNPNSSSFGRIDASLESTVDMTLINGSTERCESR